MAVELATEIVRHLNGSVFADTGGATRAADGGDEIIRPAAHLFSLPHKAGDMKPAFFPMAVVGPPLTEVVPRPNGHLETFEVEITCGVYAGGEDLAAGLQAGGNELPEAAIGPHRCLNLMRRVRAGLWRLPRPLSRYELSLDIKTIPAPDDKQRPPFFFGGVLARYTRPIEIPRRTPAETTDMFGAGYPDNG